MNNLWNKFIYKIGSPIYDQFFNTGIFLKARRQILDSIAFKKKQRVLFVGVGTGADLELINYSDLDIVAIDYSPEMLENAKAKFINSDIKFIEMDAQDLTFENESFDYIVASLILSVVPDANKCFQEMTRVLKKGERLLCLINLYLKTRNFRLQKF